MRRMLLAAMALALAAGTAGATAAAISARAGADGVPRLHRVVLIVGENTSFGQITPAHSPYLTGTVKPRAAWLSNYHSFTKSSSLGEYVAIVSGQFTRCEANNATPDRCHQNVPNLFRQLDRAHRRWTDWQESMDNPCDWVDHGNDWSENVFSAHHNPAVYFTAVHGRRYDEAIRPRPECRSRDLPMGSTRPNDTSAFDAALSAGTLADFTLVVPNDCEDGHDPCPGPHADPVRQFDSFLARELPKIQASPGWDPAHDLIAITWDEGGDPPHQPGHPLLALMGGPVKPGVYAARYDHYSLARTLEDAFGVRRLAHARRARPITGVWG
jgi:phosphatidylinositol-3-phosphatase